MVLLPDGVPPDEIWGMVRRELRAREMSTVDHEVKPDSGLVRMTVPQALADLGLALALEPPDHELTALLTSLGSDNGAPALAVMLDAVLAGLRAEAHLTAVTVVLAPETLAEQRRCWLRIASAWAEALRAGREGPPLCLVLPATGALEALPREDIGFGQHWWWGLPSVLEVQLLCREREPAPVTFEDRWREHLLPALAGGDLSLLEALWDCPPQTEAEVLEQLCGYAIDRGWSQACLQAERALITWRHHPHRFMQVIGGPPTDLRGAWAAGWLAWSPEFGLEPHSAVLAALGCVQELRHRLWRGQLGLVLPMVDAARIDICVALAETHGSDWPHLPNWPRPEDPEECNRLDVDAGTAQIGFLDTLFRQAPWAPGPNPTLRTRWQPVLMALRSCRNESAHFRIGAFPTLEAIWRQLGRG